MHITCVQHVPFEGPAAVAAWARRRGHRLSRCQAWRSAFVQPAEAVVVLGGPMSTGDEAEYPWLRAEKRWLRRQIARGVPVVGICLGSQLLAEVLGGRVYPGPEKEIGWYPVERHASALTTAVGEALPERFPVLHWHGDTYERPPGAVPLARSPVCPEQGFLWGERVLGLQFHLEATPASATRLANAAADELVGGGRWVQQRDALLAPGPHWQRANDLLAPLLDLILDPPAGPGSGRRFAAGAASRPPLSA